MTIEAVVLPDNAGGPAARVSGAEFGVDASNPEGCSC